MFPHLHLQSSCQNFNHYKYGKTNKTQGEIPMSELDKTIEELEAEVQSELEEAAQDAPKKGCLLYTSPSPRDRQKSRMPSSA